MAIDPDKLRNALRRILDVERTHMFGARTGSQTSRRNDLERELDKLLIDLARDNSKGGNK